MVILGLLAPPAGARSAQINWMGHTWTVTNGRMAGVAPGRPANAGVDPAGYLDLNVTRKAKTVSAAEVFSTDAMGFGTYQWQIQGPVDRMDPQTVLGLFPYGPQSGIGQDGENEIDIEFSKWNGTLCGGACNADFNVYPSTSHRGTGSTEDAFGVNLEGGDLLTARLQWSSTSITETVMAGLQPLNSTAGLLHKWTFSPPDYLVRIPQQAVPLGMNLWCSRRRCESSQAVKMRSFQYVPAG